MQSVRAIVGVLVLAWGFVQAPFAHVHSEELEHHSSSPVHFHLQQVDEDAGTPHIEARTADEDSIDVQWGIASAAPVVLIADLAVAPTYSNIPELSNCGITVPPQTRGHDPPDISPKQPRAPPA